MYLGDFRKKSFKQSKRIKFFYIMYKKIEGGSGDVCTEISFFS